ncbi:MAG: hypothetical protein JWM74_1546 [Myxococcaceae bacterium]|jgi:hypothetical protein|nr:hypothetical protein [Myxococcaceae bacterium]
MHHNRGVPHSTLRAPRRALALCALGSLFALAVACSQSTSHPPVSGDCIGDLCPPATSRGVGSTPGSGGDAASEAGSPDADVAETAGPDDAGNFPDVNTTLPDVGID